MEKLYKDVTEEQFRILVESWEFSSTTAHRHMRLQSKPQMVINIVTNWLISDRNILLIVRILKLLTLLTL